MLLHWDATDWELCGPQASPHHTESEERTILAPATHSSTTVGEKLWPRQHHNINFCPFDEQKYVIIFSKAHHPLSFTLQTSEKNNLSIYTIFTKYLRDLKGSTENTINFGPFKIYEIHVWMWQLNYKESWRLKNWCFWTVVLEKTLENLWTARRSNPS